MGSYAEYRRPVWPWQWVRWWVARQQDRRHPPDRSDGRDYTGWEVLVRVDHDGLLPAGTRGRVVSSDRQCGELAHRIEFPGWTVTTPLPWPGIELVAPVDVDAV